MKQGERQRVHTAVEPKCTTPLTMETVCHLVALLF